MEQNKLLLKQQIKDDLARKRDERDEQQRVYKTNYGPEETADTMAQMESKRVHEQHEIKNELKDQIQQKINTAKVTKAIMKDVDKVDQEVNQAQHDKEIREEDDRIHSQRKTYLQEWEKAKQLLDEDKLNAKIF